MSTLGVMTLVGLIAVVALVLVYLKLRSRDVIEDILQKRAGNSKYVARADFVEGIERMPVALAIDDRALYYENEDMQASLDLPNIDEVEYDDELATGKMLTDKKVMRVRAHGQSFEFVLDSKEAPKWQQALPPRTTTAPSAQVH